MLIIDARTLPVFSTPPSILFVDLDLSPGETKKCKFQSNCYVTQDEKLKCQKSFI
jgi:hypothetical protein